MGKSCPEIVVVDDEPQITDLLRLFIESAGKPATIRIFNDAREAQEYIKTHQIDVLVTDYKMPYVNGLELLENAPSNVKKILISGYVSEIAIDRLNRLKAIFFEKPVPMAQFTQLIFGPS